MSKLDKLIARHCPNGVKHYQLQDVFEVWDNGGHSKIKKTPTTDKFVPWFQFSDIQKNGAILDDARELIAARDADGMNPSPADSIIVSAFGSKIKHALIKVPHRSSHVFVTLSLKPDYFKEIDLNFANFYCFVLDRWCTAKKNETFHSSIDMSEIGCFKFPIPPLPVQKEIVTILESFTDLEAELEAELEARRQQYNYYLNDLFSFDKSVNGARKRPVRWQTLGEVGGFVSEKGLPKGNIYSGEISYIYGNQIIKKLDVFATQTDKLISNSKAKDLNFARTGDLIITNESTSDNNVCVALAWLGEKDVAASKDTYVYRHTLDPKFVAYYFKTRQFKKQKEPFLKGFMNSWISEDSLCKIKIPVPSKKEQKRIVSILDGFHALVNDENSSISAEITARRKQHEFYRKQILSFKEAS